MRCLLALALRADGFEVIEVATGGELMDRIAELVNVSAPHRRAMDLIITDMRMPVVSGLHALARLRQFDRTTPVILITAFADEDTHVAAERLGAHVFDKPFDLEDLRMAALHLT
jgi:CheY-like chemotaxis protein